MENNINITGDEARILMASMMQTAAALPIGRTLQLYMRLAQLSQVQPPVEPQPKDKENE